MIGLLWGVTWAIAGSLTRWVVGVTTDLPLPLLFGGLGFLSGVAFSSALVLASRRGWLKALSLPRFAVAGALVGLMIGVLFVRGVDYRAVEVLAIPAGFVVASAASAAATLALARRAAPLALADDEASLLLEDPPI
ncbi:MAG: hypothetical protein K2R93_17680 [Gemmatimonadaceae bacterium]|nr:hypothetical protein [Gemmatimonadaceae bacterium]